MWRVGLAAFWLLSGCATAPKYTLTRPDGRVIQPQQAQLDSAQCRGQAAATAANSPQPVYPNLYLMAAAQEQRNQTLDSVMGGCMAQKGYLYVREPS